MFSERADQENSSQNIGQEIRAARETEGLTTAELGNVLKIQPAFITAIETLNIEALPSTGYSIGFVRAIARHLGLPADDAVARFKSEALGNTAKSVKRRPHFAPKRAIRFPKGSVAAGTLLSCLAVVASWYGMSTAANSAPETVKPATVDPVWQVETIDKTIEATDLITLKAVGPSWIEVKDANNNILISKIMVPGEQFEARRQDIPHLSLRDAGAIELYIAGKPMGLIGAKGVSIDNLPLLSENTQP